MWIVLIIIIAVIIGVSSAKAKEKRIETLKLKYNATLRGTDKKAALEAGRAYYSELRNKKVLTIYDEQAITNDLSTMKKEQ